LTPSILSSPTFDDSSTKSRTIFLAAQRCTGVERSDKFPDGYAARPACVPSGSQQEQMDNSNPEKLCSGVEQSNTKKRREADHAPSGLHQEQIAFDVDKKSQAVCREATKRTKRPSGNRTAFSFKGE
jgi:hypothetical protein